MKIFPHIFLKERTASFLQLLIILALSLKAIKIYLKEEDQV